MNAESTLLLQEARKFLEANEHRSKAIRVCLHRQLQIVQGVTDLATYRRAEMDFPFLGRHQQEMTAILSDPHLDAACVCHEGTALFAALKIQDWKPDQGLSDAARASDAASELLSALRTSLPGGAPYDHPTAHAWGSAVKDTIVKQIELLNEQDRNILQPVRQLIRDIEQHQTDPLRPGGANEKPHWDTKHRKLSFGHTLCRTFVRKAARDQEAILAAFEAAGWLESVPSPIKQYKLNYTIKRLNNGLTADAPLRFHGDGTGSGVRWVDLRALDAPQMRRR
jgi:hypothetical protein